MIASSESLDVRAICRNSRCSVSSGVSSMSPVIPMMAFIGVRISCDMFARNSDLARLAVSACSVSRAASRSCWRMTSVWFRTRRRSTATHAMHGKRAERHDREQDREMAERPPRRGLDDRHVVGAPEEQAERLHGGATGLVEHRGVGLDHAHAGDREQRSGPQLLEAIVGSRPRPGRP